MTIHIGICDDEEYYIVQLLKCVEQYAKETNLTVEINIYQSGMELLRESKEKRDNLDIVFLDVDMPEINGIETAKKLRETNEQLVICFVTSYDNYSFSAYQVDALGYTLKPARYQDVAHFLKKAILFLDAQKESVNKFIQVNVKREITMIEINKILYIEKEKNQCLIYCNDRQITCYETLEHLYQQLDFDIFIYTNQGYIVNLTKVKEVTKTFVYFSDDLKVPVSRYKYKDVHDKYMNRLMQKQCTRSTSSSLL